MAGTNPPTLHSKQFHNTGYLEMDKTIFQVSDVILTDTYSSLCVTFKVKEAQEEQYIVSDWEEGEPLKIRGIAATAKAICLQTKQKHDIVMWAKYLALFIGLLEYISPKSDPRSF